MFEAILGLMAALLAELTAHSPIHTDVFRKPLRHRAAEF